MGLLDPQRFSRPRRRRQPSKARTPARCIVSGLRWEGASSPAAFFPGTAVDGRRLKPDAGNVHRKRLTMNLRTSPSAAENLLVFARQLRRGCAVLLRGAPGFADLHHQPRLLTRECSPAGLTAAPSDLGKVRPDLAVQGDSFGAHARIVSGLRYKREARILSRRPESRSAPRSLAGD